MIDNIDVDALAMGLGLLIGFLVVLPFFIIGNKIQTTQKFATKQEWDNLIKNIMENKISIKEDSNING